MNGQRIVMFSGGVGSWAAARRVAEQYGTEDLVLLFSDTAMEDEDLYRFMREAAANVGGQLVTLKDGRDPWEVFHDVRFLGNTRVDPCSRILKREIIRRWLDDHANPDTDTVYLGIDWTEAHRFERAAPYWVPWTIRAPMCEEPFVDKAAMLDDLRAEGIAPPRLYSMGFPHNNCGGFCVKAGQAHFAHLLKMMPDRYRWHEAREQALRDFLEKDVAILRDRTGGTTTPMTLRAFRERLETDAAQCDLFEWGGCGCFTDFTTEDETP